MLNIMRQGAETPIVPTKGHLGSVDELYSLARDRTPESRIRLAQKICSILDADITIRESEMIADVLIELISQASKSVRHALALRLAYQDNVPLRLILELANDDIEIARPILVTSPVLGEFDLMYIIQAQSREYWKAIAARKVLADRVTKMLADTQDVETALVMLENEDIDLCEATMVALSDLAQQEEVIVMPLLERAEMTETLASSLYHFVGEEIRQYIVEHFRIDPEAVAKAIEEVVEETTEPLFAHDECLPDQYMLDAAVCAYEKGLLNVKMMIGTLRRGHARSFIAQLSVFTGYKPDVLVQVLSQKNGQGLALIAKAFDVRKEDFVSLFMLTGKFWKKGRFVQPNDIRKALAYFEAITPEFAREIIVPETQG